MNLEWNVELSRQAKKQYKALAYSGQKKPSIIDVVDALIIDLKIRGPELIDWPHYGIIHESRKRSYYHCHLKKGHPTYVACWEISNIVDRKIEVFYVGSHEDAPY